MADYKLSNALTMEEMMEAMGYAIDENKKKKRKKKRKIKISREYEFQRSMMFAIQAVTGQQTHEIMATLVEEADKHLDESNINISYVPSSQTNYSSYGYSSERRLKQYTFYPGTELYIGSYTLYTDYCVPTGFDARLKYNFKLPVSSLKLNEDEYNEYITDGILCDSSKDIDKPTMQGTLTKEEKETKELQYKQKQKEYAAKRKLAKANKKP